MPKQQVRISVEEHLELGRTLKAFEKQLHKTATGGDNGFGYWRFNKTDIKTLASEGYC